MSEGLILMPYQDSPFNGDIYACKEFLSLKDRFKITNIYETGSCLFSTTKWLGENFDNVGTVESNQKFYSHGVGKVSGLSNVKPHLGDSVEWLKSVVLQEVGIGVSSAFFLDAHWGDDCPLLAELGAIAQLQTTRPPVIVIHDFVTGNPELGYDEYKGQAFTWEWIEPSIKAIAGAFVCEYEHYFNTEATGAKRGIVYIVPKQS